MMSVFLFSLLFFLFYFYPTSIDWNATLLIVCKILYNTLQYICKQTPIYLDENNFDEMVHSYTLVRILLISSLEIERM